MFTPARSSDTSAATAPAKPRPSKFCAASFINTKEKRRSWGITSGPMSWRSKNIPENAVVYEHLTPTEYLELIGCLYGLPEEQSRERINELLRLFEMTSGADLRMTGFSKGMRQKIHIISGLLHNPDILFLDEPLNGLDANSVIMVKEMITQLAREGRTIFYCSHLMDVVEKVSSRIILLNEGMVAADGKAEDLMRQTGSDSLETLFAKLTNGRHSAVAPEMIVEPVYNEQV